MVLDEIDDGVTDRHFEVTAAELEVQDEFLRFEAPFTADVKIGRAMQTFTVKGAVVGTVHGECGRCLAVAQAEIKTTFRLLVQRKQADAEELEAVADEDEILVVDPGMREVDLAQAMRDAVVLDLPRRIHCRPDCKGLCSSCGADLNQGACSCSQEKVDPRWAALADLKQGK